MNKETIEAMLKEHRFKVGRRDHLLAEIDALSKQLERAKQNAACEAAALRGQQISDMPHGMGISNPTEQIAIMLSDGWKSELEKQLEAEIGLLRKESGTLSSDIQFVNAWLSGLPDRERWIIQQQVIDGVYWRDLTIRYRMRFGDDVSKDTLKRIRDKAMQMIFDIAA